MSQLNEKLCNGNLVRYSHPDHGTMYLPLEDRPNYTGAEIFNFHDTNKHPLWLAELVASCVHELFADHILESEWCIFAYKACVQITLHKLVGCTFSHAVWDLLQDFIFNEFDQLRSQTDSHDTLTSKTPRQE